MVRQQGLRQSDADEHGKRHGGDSSRRRRRRHPDEGSEQAAGVVDAIAEGGVRALEVTMTVPGAVELIAQLGRDAAARLPARRRHGARRGDGAPGRSTPARSFIVSPVFRRDGHRGVPRRDVAAMPGCFTPTEILDAWDAGADIVKVFPATALGPPFFKDVRGPLPQVKLMPTGGVTLDNAGDWIRAGAVAVGVGTALLDAESDRGIGNASTSLRDQRASASSRSVRAARGASIMMPKVVTFGEIMLRLSPPGFERFLQSPVLVATFGGGEANVAVSLAQFGLDSCYVTRLPKHAIGDAADARAARRGRAHRLHRPRRRSGRHLLRRGRRQPARAPR